MTSHSLTTRRKKSVRTRRVVRSAPARMFTTPKQLPLNAWYSISTKLNPYAKARLALTSKQMYALLKNNLAAYKRIAGTSIRKRKGPPDYSTTLRGPPREPPRKKTVIYSS
jgi:hypothetical protein